MSVLPSNGFPITKCKGVGEDVKVNWVRRLKIHHKATFFGIQETLMQKDVGIQTNTTLMTLIPVVGRVVSSLYGTPDVSKN